MTKTIETVRETGAKNVLIADGLGVGQTIDGAPLLNDPQVAYASHPYAMKQYGQTRQAWDAKFGNFSRRAPVIITEWIAGGYFCDLDTPESTVKFVQYLQEHRIGLEVGVWDWAPGWFRQRPLGLSEWQVSQAIPAFRVISPAMVAGKVIETWYTTGVPANSPE